MGATFVEEFQVSGGNTRTSKTSCFLDDGTVLLTLEDETEQKVYPKGVNALPRVWQHNSGSIGVARG
jgi:hypothetical protein